MQHIERQKLVISAENRTCFDEIRRDFCARHAPRACRSFAIATGSRHTTCKACALTLRAFAVRCAHFRHRTCAVLRVKFARFCVQKFEIQRECGHRRTHVASKRCQGSFDARCTSPADFAEIGAVFCSSFGGKNLRLSVKIAKISKKFGAMFARDTRPEPAKPAQKSQTLATQRQIHVC